MKKIIFLLFILLLNLSFSNNSAQSDSKRVFEKSFNCILSGNLEKCRNDKELKRSLDINESNVEEIEVIKMIKILKLSEDVKYEIIDVQEKQNESIITVKLKIRQITDTHEKVYDEVDKLLPAGRTVITVDDLIEIYPKVRNKLKYKFVESTMKIYMDKQDGMWDTLETGINEKFFESISHGFESFLNYYDFEDAE